MMDNFDAAAIENQITKAEISTEIKKGLNKVVDFYGNLRPELGNRDRFLTSYYCQFAVEEIINPNVETHWWELHLDLLCQAEKTVGKGERPLQNATSQLSPLVRAHFGPQEPVTLQEINDQTVRGICRLSETLTDPQDLFVAPNAHSLAQAHFHPGAWFRAIYAGKTPVGFLMLAEDREKPEYFLWRYMIAAPYQGRGYGRAAIDLLADYVRILPGAQELLVSCVPHPQGPYEFYRKCGFADTGEVEGIEVVLKMLL